MGRILLIVFGAGGLGGLLNAFLTGPGVALPHFVVVEGSKVLVPGFLGNILVGAVAALISYGLYGPLANIALVRGGPSTDRTPLPSGPLTLAACAGAIVVGFSGGRWMTAEADKQLNHATAVVTAQAAEKLAVSKGVEGALRVQSGAQPPTANKPAPLLSESIQTETPAEAYEQALKIRQAIESSGRTAP
jgi:hypothetical protein